MRSTPMFRASQAEADAQIDDERREVEYDTAEFTTELVVQKLRDEDVYIPDYQRPHVWIPEMKSAFIESLLLALPIPYVFLSDTGDGRLEVIDGSQRIRTLQEFFDNKFRLSNLEKLDTLDGFAFEDLSLAQQRRLKNRPVRTIILTERADSTTRFDIFHRLNRYGKPLTDSQVRRGAFPGPFYAMVEACAKDGRFVQMCSLKNRKDARGEREELVLRFLAYSDRYQDFRHDVGRFLNKYIVEANEWTPDDIEFKRQDFDQMLEFVANYFPYGFRRAPGSQEVPRVRFEAISVGAILALRINATLEPSDFDWLDSEEFRNNVRTDASNSARKLRARVEYVRDRLLESA